MITIKKYFHKYLSLALTLALTLTVLSANSLIQPVYASGSTGPNGEFIPPGYELATASDFIIYPPVNVPGARHGYQYIGTKPYVVIPHKINGIELEGYDYMWMFRGEDAKHVRGVASNNPKITDLMFMFVDNPSPSLDLRYLDVSNVTNMTGMFLNCKATTINMSGWDTSKVWSMIGMFEDSKVKTINLDHFDFSSLLSSSYMFKNAQATNISLKNFNLAEGENIDYNEYYACIGLMFEGTKITSIDLSNLRLDDYIYKDKATQYLEGNDKPLKKLTYNSSMFKGSSIKTVYVGNEEVAEYLNDEYKPAGLKIIVK